MEIRREGKEGRKGGSFLKWNLFFKNNRHTTLLK